MILKCYQCLLSLLQQLQHLNMSKQSAYRASSRRKISSDEQSMPDQWSSVQNRLDFLQTTIVKLQKRTQKVQKKLMVNEDQLSILKKQCLARSDELKKGQNIQMMQRQRQAQLGHIRSELEELHQHTKRIQKKSLEMFKELKSVGGSGMDVLLEEELGEKLQRKLERHYKKSKHYIDQAVSQLKSLIQQYVKDQVQLQNKIIYSANEASRSHSKTKSNQRSSQSIKASQIKIEPLRQFTQTSFDDKSKCKSPKSIENNSSSRVSYLRQKLKQFQEINKKYEDRTDKKIVPRDEEKFNIQKMKDFKDYLEQSESEIDQSNLQTKEPNFFDSSKRHRADRFRLD